MSTQPQNLFMQERRRLILEKLRGQGRVSVNDLSEQLAVSAVTIRQDLRALEEEGLLERTYGGAVLPAAAQASPELSFDARQRHDRAIKAVIAQAAAARVQEGFTIALDGSTTAFGMLAQVKVLEKLIVVTNSLMVAQALLDSPHIQVWMPGGWLRRDSISLIGRPDTLPDININVGFFGTRGITLATGFTESDGDESASKRALLKRCVQTVIVAGPDKWGKIAPYTFAEPDEIHTILTTDAAPPHLVAQFRERGVPVETLPTPAV